ncbi:hypothetical protein Ddye_021943 [Dipteronia dyeriana]|uniref:Reverse transcriptase n=1 Tax=Dipteronia dyeriana TaxID=168575 RepID=A0AAD9U3C0_9ROSI|nr:hypothetical protein Ddye_021943 [Dipteronia dyeriana]
MVIGVVLYGDMVHMSHLKFVDDTTHFIKTRIEYLKNLRRILCCFELVSRKALRPLLYLGLPIDANPSLKSCWNPIVERIERRLASWKMRFLSKDGRLVLIKTVLSSIPTYYVLVFRITVGFAQSIKKLQLVRKRAIWRKVLCAKYRINDRWLSWDWHGPKVALDFVKAMRRLLDQGSKSANILKEGMSVVIGNGMNARFWDEIKYNSLTMREAFPRIFALSVNKK